MTRKTGKAQSIVERLIEQRRLYTDWLEKLDEESAGAAPSHVTDRVREDYRARLKGVTAELREHEEGIRQALSESEARVEELVQERQARSDELSEARLRRQVGEFGDDQFEEIEERCKAALGELGKEIGANERDIARLAEVLALIQGREEAAPPPHAPAAPAPVAAAPASGAPPAPAAKPAAAPQMNLDELEFLRSVVDTPKPGQGRPSGSVSAVPAPAPSPAPPAPRAPEPPPAAKPAPPPPPPSPSQPPPAPRARERRPAEPGQPEAKTLRCAECGTMNAPTEWYCEKCGAELSTF